MRHQHQQYPAHLTQEDVGREIRSQEFGGLLTVCLAHQQQHGRGYRTIELHETIHVDESHGIGNHIAYALHPYTDFLWQDREEEEQYTHIYQQLREEMLIDLRISCLRQYGISRYDAQCVHEYKEGNVPLHDVFYKP
jgi:hypothetical protein